MGRDTTKTCRGDGRRLQWPQRPLPPLPAAARALLCARGRLRAVTRTLPQRNLCQAAPTEPMPNASPEARTTTLTVPRLQNSTAPSRVDEWRSLRRGCYSIAHATPIASATKRTSGCSVAAAPRWRPLQSACCRGCEPLRGSFSRGLLHRRCRRNQPPMPTVNVSTRSSAQCCIALRAVEPADPASARLSRTLRCFLAYTRIRCRPTPALCRGAARGYRPRRRWRDIQVPAR